MRKPIEVFLQEDHRMMEVGKVRRQVAVVDDKVSEGTKEKIKRLYAEDRKHEQANTVKVVEALPGSKGRKTRVAGTKRKYSAISGTSAGRSSSRLEKASRSSGRKTAAGGSGSSGDACGSPSSSEFSGERKIGKTAGEPEKERLRKQVIHFLAQTMAASWKSVQSSVSEELPSASTSDVMKTLSKVATKAGGQSWSLRDSCLSEVDVDHWPSFSADDREFVRNRIESYERDRAGGKGKDSSSGHVFAAPRNSTPSKQRNSTPSLRKSSRRLSARLESKQKEQEQEEEEEPGQEAQEEEATPDGGPEAATEDVVMEEASEVVGTHTTAKRRESGGGSGRRKSRERGQEEEQDPKVHTFQKERSSFQAKYTRYRELWKLLDDNQTRFADYRNRFLDKKLPHEEREQLGTKIEREYSRLKDTVSKWRAEYNALHEELSRKKAVIEKLAGELKKA